ncbi:glycosyltransferase [Staphylococcus shinii]|uniref:glycosyltransferase n=2 Tax=Staphylococcus shinii TaxID=2912228 RepID=UPI000AD279B8|nr:glycosyltransferase family 2 protein [Staphylococcus shinii]
MVLYMIAMVLTILSLICGMCMYTRRAVISNSEKDSGQTAVSVIIPARNEVENLPKLLNSIGEEQEIEVIIMDDGSTDDTPDVARYHGASVYTVKNNDTWQGKSHACWQGSQFASHNLLMFVDADVQFTNGYSIQRIVNQYYLQDSKGLLSIQPYHKIKKLYENISAIFNLMTIVGMNKFSIIKSSNKEQSAFGPVILTNKRDYELTQGHLKAKDQIIEGFAISKAYHDYDLPVKLYEGQGVVNFRMYPQGYKALLEGWSKHFALGTQVTKKSTLTFVFLWLFGSLVTILAVIFSINLDPLYMILAIIFYFIYALQFHLFIRRTGNFSLITSICHPVLFICFVVIFIKSWLDINVFKRIHWKGRKIDL